MRNQTTNN
jgi:hypothetical protein